jgi:hypothetical protein
MNFDYFVYKSLTLAHTLGQLNSLHSLQTNYRYFPNVCSYAQLGYNIKMILEGVGWQDVDWNHLDENKERTGSCEHSNEPEIILSS